MSRLWLHSFSEVKLRRLFSSATPEQESAMLACVTSSNTGRLEDDAELSAQLEREPSFVEGLVRRLARGTLGSELSALEWRVVDDVTICLLDNIGPSLYKQLLGEGESPDGFFDLRPVLEPLAATARERAVLATLFAGRRLGQALGDAPGMGDSGRYFLLDSDEVAGVASDLRAVADRLPASPPRAGGLLARLRHAVSEFFDTDYRAIVVDLLVQPLERVAAKKKAAYGVWD